MPRRRVDSLRTDLTCGILISSSVLSHSHSFLTQNSVISSVIHAQRVANFNLDTALRDACASDFKNRCQHSLEEIDKDANVRDSALNCLQNYKDELESEQCRSEVSDRCACNTALQCQNAGKPQFHKAKELPDMCAWNRNKSGTRQGAHCACEFTDCPAGFPTHRCTAVCPEQAATSCLMRCLLEPAQTTELPCAVM